MNASSVPLVSLRAFVDNAASDSSEAQAARAEVAEQINDACINCGFFYVTDHGIPEEVISAAFARSRQFFETLPYEEKLQLDATRNALYRGYISEQSGAHTCAARRQEPGHKDSKESYTIGAEDMDYTEEIADGANSTQSSDAKLSSFGKHRYTSPMHGPNQWPDESRKDDDGQQTLLGWKQDLDAYWSHMLALCKVIGRCLALSLKLEEDFFEKHLQHPCAQMVLLRYAPQEKIGCNAHTDCGFLTILAQEDPEQASTNREGNHQEVAHESGSPHQASLEVKHADPSIGWVGAPPIKGALIVNLGDMAQRWSNDEYSSTWHRVINRTGAHRYSIPFFCNCDFETPVECICKDGAKYERITAGEYILKRLGLMRLLDAAATAA